jgi:hypothetical protein
MLRHSENRKDYGEDNQRPQPPSNRYDLRARAANRRRSPFRHGDILHPSRLLLTVHWANNGLGLARKRFQRSGRSIGDESRNRN